MQLFKKKNLHDFKRRLLRAHKLIALTLVLAEGGGVACVHLLKNQMHYFFFFSFFFTNKNRVDIFNPPSPSEIRVKKHHNRSKAKTVRKINWLLKLKLGTIYFAASLKCRMSALLCRKLYLKKNILYLLTTEEGVRTHPLIITGFRPIAQKIFKTLTKNYFS